MKRFLLASCGLILFLLVSHTTHAIPVDIVYTADNVVNSWFIDGGGATASISPGVNASTWQQADSYTVDLDSGTTYQIIWQVEDYDDDWDVAGFLAEISSSDPMVGTLSSSTLWEVTTDNDWDASTTSWASATAYAYNGASGDPWGTTVSGISTNAQWIWTNNSDHTATGIHGWEDFQTGDKNIFVRVTLETAPVPEPATMMLFGIGLLGLAGVSRRKK